MRILCGTVGTGTDEDPYRPYVADFGLDWNGKDMRGDPAHGAGPWSVELVRPDGMSQADYDAAISAILADPRVNPA